MDRNGLPTGDVFEVLSNQRRRYVVQYLLWHNSETELRKLSEQVAAWENEKQPEEVTRDEKRRVYNALHQFHLPKMDDTEIIEYNNGRNLIDPTDSLDDLQEYLNTGPESSKTWCMYYLALGGLSTVLFLGTLFDFSVFATLSEFAVGMGVTALFTITAAAHAIYLMTENVETTTTMEE